MTQLLTNKDRTLLDVMLDDIRAYLENSYPCVTCDCCGITMGYCPLCGERVTSDDAEERRSLARQIDEYRMVNSV